jgi:hypothetical protein
MQNVNELLQQDSLVQLIQPDQFVGWTYRIDYETAIVLTNDLWKSRAHGVPHNCFLLATSIAPDKLAEIKEAALEVVLLRVVGASPLPLDDKLIHAKIENLKDRTSSTAGRELDDLTKSELQFGGLECRILGTFFTQGGKLRLGSDVESYLAAVQLNVYRPTAAALGTIVNYISPERVAAAAEEAERLDLKGELPKFPIGTVRYTSTDRLHRAEASDRVVFNLNAIDFLARRTAVFGMTRTGKSNMVKQLVSVVMRTSAKCGLKIGQIIYDLNGEYANANQQDKGSIAEVYPHETVRYRMMPMAGFQPILNNFFTQVPEGFSTLRALFEANRISRSADMESFLSISFDEPRKEDFENDGEFRRQSSRHQRKVAAYQAVLSRAGFEVPKNFKIRFDANASVRKIVNPAIDPKDGLTPAQALAWFSTAREKQDQLFSSGGDPWIDPDTKALLNMLVQKNDKDGYISGFRLLQPFKEYHSPTRNTDVGEEIYQHLLAGRIVILDLSVGDPAQRERLGKRIAQHIFQNSMVTFNAGKHPPHIVIYVEEAHNIIGRNEALTETWPRIAKEGAKARIATVYATQEVSSIHPNILANTENMLVSHLNNENEMRELSKFYDFRDFSNSIMRAQDVGFDRVKTLSNPFVIPIQIDKFDPEAEKARAAKSEAK